MTSHFNREAMTAHALPIEFHGTATITNAVLADGSGGPTMPDDSPGGRKRRSTRKVATASTDPSGAVNFPSNSGRNDTGRPSGRAPGTVHIVPAYLLLLSACATPRASVSTTRTFEVFCSSTG